jgi:nucleotide-binding universal stress UspA family protein
MLALDKILLPVDFSERCLGAARNAVPTLARHFNSEVTLLHVLPDYSGSTELGPFLSRDLMATKKPHARRHLDSWLSEELRHLPVKRVLAEGEPAQTIVEYAHTEHSDLVMMPTHGYGPFRKLLLGSVTAKVLHDAKCPVWTGVHLEKEPPGEPMVLRHILCAVDLKPHSEKTLRWAKDLATAFQSKLSLVHVGSSFDPRARAHSLALEWQEAMFDEAGDDLEKLQSSAGTQAEVHLEMGDIPRTVCLAAQDLKADLLVIGRGTTADGGGRFPADAYSIVRQSPCPVVGV